MFAFYRTNLLVGMGASNSMSDAGIFEVIVKATIFATPIRLDDFYFMAKLFFHISLKLEKNIFNLDLNFIGNGHKNLEKLSRKLT